VIRGVLFRRVVAAADVPAEHAEPEVDPPGPDRQALFAALSAGFDVGAGKAGVQAGFHDVPFVDGAGRRI
jgi:hypothetical protein